MLFNQSFSLDSFPTLREFQTATHLALREGAMAGNKAQMIAAPTGSGKTILALYVVAQALQKGRKVTFLCDRTTLINQTSQVALSLGLDHGVIQAQHPRRDDSAQFQIASAQTIARRGWHKTDLIIIDEAHTQLSAWTDYIPHFDGSVIGLSATPFSKGLGKLFSNLINATTMHELTQSGVLVPMKVISATKIDMQGAMTSFTGEWAESEIQARGKEILGDVVKEWSQYGENRKTIVFGANIAHCEDLCRQFIDAGIMAAVFTSETKADEREYLLSAYKSGDIKVLISVEALAKGFDVPDVSCVVDCRPLRKSLSTAIQMWGRGLRSSPSTDKKDCILLDHSGNIIRFLEDFTDIYFNGLEKLDDGEKLDKKIRGEDEDKEAKGCPSCGYKPFYKRCMSCGHEHISQNLVQHEAGQMRVIDMPVMAKGKKLAENHHDLWKQLCTYAEANSLSDKRQGRAFHLYKNITGMTPKWNFETAPVITPHVANKIKSLNIAYVKARRSA